MVEKHRYKIQNRLSSFTYWLYDEKFLGLQKVIDVILKPLETLSHSFANCCDLFFTEFIL